MASAADYRPELDGLRAVAVGLVLAFHFFPEWLPGGFVGVDVFFVISGYLITRLILTEVDAGNFSLAHFYARRARRILPALTVVLLAILLAGWLVLFPGDFKRLALQTLAAAFFVPNLLSWSEVGYFDPAAIDKPLLHLWSLGVEEQFYLAWPLFLMAAVFRPRKILIMAIASVIVASFAYSAYAAWHQPSAAFYSPLSRVWELGLGGLLACVTIRLPRFCSLLGLVLIAASSILITPKDAFPGFAALAPVVGAALVIASRPVRQMTTSVVVGLGLISYPLYLWHWPLLSFATVAGVPTTTIERGALIATSLVLAWATYEFIEKPVRFGRLRRWAVSGSCAGIAATVSMATCILVLSGVPSRFSPDIIAVVALNGYEFAKDARASKCWISQEQAFSEYEPECSKGNILIWGDSHAARLYPGLRSAFGDVAQFTRDSCPPLLHEVRDACSLSNRSVMAHIQASVPETVILFASWLAYDFSAADLGRTLRQLQAAGVENVILLGPTPNWGEPLPNIVHAFWRRHGYLPDRLTAKVMKPLEGTMRRTAQDHGARFVSVSDQLCDESGCLTHTPSSRSDLLTWDYGHLTTTGAVFIVQQLSHALVSADATRRPSAAASH